MNAAMVAECRCVVIAGGHRVHHDDNIELAHSIKAFAHTFSLFAPRFPVFGGKIQ
jgi:hypothetical protein